MNAYDVGVDLYFIDPHLSRSALYREGGGGDGRPVQVVETRPDIATSYGDTRLLAETGVFALRVWEVVNPQPGDTLTLDGRLYTVVGEPARDPGMRVWTLNTRPS